MKSSERSHYQTETQSATQTYTAEFTQSYSVIRTLILLSARVTMALLFKEYTLSAQSTVQQNASVYTEGSTIKLMPLKRIYTEIALSTGSETYITHSVHNE